MPSKMLLGRASSLVLPWGTPCVLDSRKKGEPSGCARAVVVISVVRKAPPSVSFMPSKREATTGDAGGLTAGAGATSAFVVAGEGAGAEPDTRDPSTI